MPKDDEIRRDQRGGRDDERRDPGPYQQETAECAQYTHATM